MKIVCICNQKGGVGKTTTTLNLAAALHAHGKRVLVMDTDRQGNLTGTVQGQGDGPERKQSVSELIHYTVADLPYAPEMFISHCGGLDLVASSNLLSAANSVLGTVSSSEAVLTRAIGTLTHDGQDYDFVLIDCAPSLDLLVVNALNASDSVVIPTEAADYSIDGIIGVWETITRIQKTTNPKLHVSQIVINKFQVCKKDHKGHAAEIKEAFPSVVFPTPIPLMAEVERSTKRGDEAQPLKDNRNSRVWPLYMELAEVMIRE